MELGGMRRIMESTGEPPPAGMVGGGEEAGGGYYMMPYVVQEVPMGGYSMQPHLSPQWGVMDARSGAGENPGQTKRARRVYNKTTEKRENWTESEQKLFEEALDKYQRDWKKIEAHVQTRTALQIRSHAQKYFKKLAKEKPDAFIPPARPKRKSSGVGQKPTESNSPALQESPRAYGHPQMMPPHYYNMSGGYPSMNQSHAGCASCRNQRYGMLPHDGVHAYPGYNYSYREAYGYPVRSDGINPHSYMMPYGYTGAVRTDSGFATQDTEKHHVCPHNISKQDAEDGGQAAKVPHSYLNTPSSRRSGSNKVTLAGVEKARNPQRQAEAAACRAHRAEVLRRDRNALSGSTDEKGQISGSKPVNRTAHRTLVDQNQNRRIVEEEKNKNTASAKDGQDENVGKNREVSDNSASGGDNGNSGSNSDMGGSGVELMADGARVDDGSNDNSNNESWNDSEEPLSSSTGSRAPSEHEEKKKPSSKHVHSRPEKPDLERIKPVAWASDPVYKMDIAHKKLARAGSSEPESSIPASHEPTEGMEKKISYTSSPRGDPTSRSGGCVDSSASSRIKEP